MGATIGVAELRQDASHWLRRVEAGETITVTNRGRPVATLSPLRPTTGLAALRAEGRISEPAGDFHATLGAVARSRGSSLTEDVLRRREDERS